MALYKYTFDEVIQEICSRVNDPDRDTYGDRAKELFYESAVTLVKDGNFSPDECPGLIVFAPISVPFIGGDYTLDLGSDEDLGEICIRLLSIVDDYENNEDAVINQHKYIPISIDKYKQMIDPEMRPFDDEIYYFRVGSKVRFYPFNSMQNQNIIVQFVKHPDSFLDDDELQGWFSLDFIYKMINYSVAKLKQEIQGE